MIGKDLAQEECNWPSKFQGMDFNISKILSLPFNKVCPPSPFLVPASLIQFYRKNAFLIFNSIKKMPCITSKLLNLPGVSYLASDVWGVRSPLSQTSSEFTSRNPKSDVFLEFLYVGRIKSPALSGSFSKSTQNYFTSRHYFYTDNICRQWQTWSYTYSIQYYTQLFVQYSIYSFLLMIMNNDFVYKSGKQKLHALWLDYSLLWLASHSSPLLYGLQQNP